MLPSRGAVPVGGPLVRALSFLYREVGGSVRPHVPRPPKPQRKRPPLQSVLAQFSAEFDGRESRRHPVPALVNTQPDRLPGEHFPHIADPRSEHVLAAIRAGAERQCGFAESVRPIQILYAWLMASGVRASELSLVRLSPDDVADYRRHLDAQHGDAATSRNATGSVDPAVEK